MILKYTYQLVKVKKLTGLFLQNVFTLQMENILFFAFKEKKRKLEIWLKKKKQWSLHS